MNKKIAWLLMTLLFAQMTYADTCPSLKAIKSSPLSAWKAFDSDDQKPLTTAQTTTFINSIDQFSLAEWVQEGPKKGTIHCYYSDRNGSVLEAYLAKASYIPVNNKHFWYEVSGSMHCAAGMDNCLFNVASK
jgi:hypothetical protein